MLTRNKKMKMRRMTKRKRGGVNSLPSENIPVIETDPIKKEEQNLLYQIVRKIRKRNRQFNPVKNFFQTRQINKLNKQLRSHYNKNRPSLLYPKQPSENAKKKSSGTRYGFSPEQVEKAPSSGTRYGFPPEAEAPAKNKTKRRPPPLIFAKKNTSSSSY